MRPRASSPETKIDLSAIRTKLENAKGPNYWRSLEEVAETPEFQAFVEDEFPSRADDLKNPATRREVLRLMGAAFAMAGITGCTRQPREEIVPYVRQPDDIVLGGSLFFATAMPFRGAAVGLLVESREGRPIKVEGNPAHPGSLGRTTAWNQTSTYDLYDPDRSQAVIFRGRISGWGQFLGAMVQLRETIGDGEGLHILSEPIYSPTLLDQRAELSRQFPRMQWHQYDPAGQDAAMEGARLSFGEPLNTVYLIERADTIVSLDADFLFSMPASVPYARAFIARRHAGMDRARMNRLYVFEPTPSPTGDKADHKLPVKASEIEPIARALAARLGISSGAAPQLRPEIQPWVEAIAADLQSHRGTSLVIPGEMQPPIVHALAHSINNALGNAGRTVVYTEAADPGGTGQAASLKALVDAMQNRRVKALLMLDCNPAYNTPADLEFATHLRSVPLRIHAGPYVDETAVLSEWHLPTAHYLESWSDTVAFDGTVSIVQPLIAPIYGNRTVHEILASLTDQPSRTGYEIVRAFWRRQYGEQNFDEFWRRALHDGVIPRTAFAQRTVTPRPAALQQGGTATQAGEEAVEIVFRPDPSVWDGRFSNNPCLQELPKPHTKLTWDNAAYVSPRMAERLGLENEDLIELEYRGRKVRTPVWVTPGQADGSVAVFFGYGRSRGGRNATGVGYNAYALRTSDAPYFGSGLQIRKLGERYPLACTQNHHSLEGRDIVRSAANQVFIDNPKMFVHEHDRAGELSLYPGWEYSGYRWGMTIDLTACVGCNACVSACMLENNVPVVGKDQVRRAREMHWLRVDRYYEGNLDSPNTHFQPVLCMHCEQAPCEPVCPVAATVHSIEGLNQMVYNRCIGTRYCSNNCPYKVRRFNFYLWQDWETPSLSAMRNPEVTVRSRGVMEKCTFCVQRIEAAKIEAEKEKRRVRDGEVVTACQGACPTDAIIFGDLSDKASRVSQLQQNPLAYKLLPELGTRPRVSYMAELRNINPTLEQSGTAEARH
jgi:molybdopterin-containing oxidoreductase family iron-sulfur binding subunit